MKTVGRGKESQYSARWARGTLGLFCDLFLDFVYF